MALADTLIPEKPQTASVSLGVEFASGSYGTDTTARSVYVPLIATWSPSDRFDIGIELPFVYQSNTGTTTGVTYSSLGATPSRGGRGANRTAASQQATVSTVTGSSQSDVSGLGDIILRAGVVALFESDLVPQIRPSIMVKCPTADTADGLGSGEVDAGFGVEVTKWIGDLHITGEGFYTYQGKAEGMNLKNYFSYTAGVGYQLTKSLEPMLLIKGATAPSDASGNLLEARVRLIWSLTGSTSLDLYGSRGIVDSSPEYGGGIAVIYSF